MASMYSISACDLTNVWSHQRPSGTWKIGPPETQRLIMRNAELRDATATFRSWRKSGRHRRAVNNSGKDSNVLPRSRKSVDKLYVLVSPSGWESGFPKPSQRSRSSQPGLRGINTFTVILSTGSPRTSKPVGPKAVTAPGVMSLKVTVSPPTSVGGGANTVTTLIRWRR